MKFLTWQNILILILLAAFVFRECTRPDPEIDTVKETQFKTNIAILEADKKEAQARQDSIGKFYRDSIAKINVVVKAQDRRNQVLTKQLIKLRTPRVDTLIIENPDLKSFVDTQTEIIQEQKQEIDTLKSALDFHAKVNQDLISLENIEDKIEASMAIENSIRVADLERQAKKKEKKSRIAKILIPVAAVAGLLLGSQL